MSKECEWKQDYYSIWYTACGNAHEFMNGSPADNGYEFCPYCGAELVSFIETQEESK